MTKQTVTTLAVWMGWSIYFVLVYITAGYFTASEAEAPTARADAGNIRETIARCEMEGYRLARKLLDVLPSIRVEEQREMFDALSNEEFVRCLIRYDDGDDPQPNADLKDIEVTA